MRVSFFDNAEAFRNWVKKNQDTASELWVGFRKVATMQPSISWPESVDEALCVGWIDGIRRRIDESSCVIRFSPRRASSTWSAFNIARAQALIREGGMQPASYRKAAMWWVVSARKEKTRLKRLAELIEVSAQGRWLRQYLRAKPQRRGPQQTS